jgi:coronin-1B/1C/6
MKFTYAIYLRDGLVFTTGFSKTSNRQYSLRAPGRLNDPIIMKEFDTSTGVMFPLYDADIIGRIYDQSTTKHS